MSAPEQSRPLEPPPVPRVALRWPTEAAQALGVSSGVSLGAQRRVEARIGQLLPKQQGKALRPHADEVSRNADRHDFRLLARALDGDCELTDEE